MHYTVLGSSQVTAVIKKLLASARDKRDVASIPELGRFPRRRARQSTPVCLPGASHGQRGAWWHRLAELDTAEVTAHTYALC